MPTVGAGLSIAAGPESVINRIVLSNGGMRLIGLISYPLYLWHWPLLSLGRSTAMGIEHPRITTLAMVTISFVLSFATFQYVEKRLRSGSKLSNKAVVPGLFAALSMVTMVGAITIHSEGWDSRYPEAVRPFLDYKFSYETSFRNHRCLLAGRETEFAAECSGNRSSALLLIWGDSHGAMLFQALNEVALSKGFSVAQFTSSSCPPVLAFDKKDRPLCRGINDEIFRKIVQLRPTTVVLAHDWPQSISEHPLQGLPTTVEELRKAGVRRIVLFGVVPRWEKALNVELVHSMRKMDLKEVPARMLSRLDDSTRALDVELLAVSKRLSIEYVSAYESLCTIDGCLVTIGKGSNKDLTAFDDAHLTLTAARFLVREHASKFFSEDR